MVLQVDRGRPGAGGAGTQVRLDVEPTHERDRPVDGAARAISAKTKGLSRPAIVTLAKARSRRRRRHRNSMWPKLREPEGREGQVALIPGRAHTRRPQAAVRVVRHEDGEVARRQVVGRVDAVRPSPGNDLSPDACIQPAKPQVYVGLPGVRPCARLIPRLPQRTPTFDEPAELRGDVAACLEPRNTAELRVDRVEVARRGPVAGPQRPRYAKSMEGRPPSLCAGRAREHHADE